MSDVRLLPGEEIVWEARVSWVVYVYAVAMFAALMVVRDLGRLATTKLVLTNKRVVGRRGMLNAIDVPYEKISTVHVSRGLFGKLFDFGEITITTKEGKKFSCKGIAEPLYVHMQIEEAVEVAVLGYKLSDYVGETDR